LSFLLIQIIDLNQAFFGARKLSHVSNCRNTHLGRKHLHLKELFPPFVTEKPDLIPWLSIWQSQRCWRENSKWLTLLIRPLPQQRRCDFILYRCHVFFHARHLRINLVRYPTRKRYSFTLDG
jgi:hypothetical protein